jgi:hypothetical protein
MLRIRIKMRSGAYVSSPQDTDYAGARGGQEFMGAVDYTKSGCPDIDVCTSRFEPLCYLLGPWAVDGSFVSYKGIQGGFEDLWISGAGSAEEPGLLRRHDQGGVAPLRGLEDPKLPLSAPNGVQLAPTSPKLVEG